MNGRRYIDVEEIADFLGSEGLHVTESVDQDGNPILRVWRLSVGRDGVPVPEEAGDMIIEDGWVDTDKMQRILGRGAAAGMPAHGHVGDYDERDEELGFEDEAEDGELEIEPEDG